MASSPVNLNLERLPIIVPISNGLKIGESVTYDKFVFPSLLLLICKLSWATSCRQCRSFRRTNKRWDKWVPQFFLVISRVYKIRADASSGSDNLELLQSSLPEWEFHRSFLWPWQLNEIAKALQTPLILESNKTNISYRWNITLNSHHVISSNCPCIS